MEQQTTVTRRMGVMDQLRISVRPLITYAFTLGLIAGVFMRLIPVDSFVTIAATAIGHWFGSQHSNTSAT